MRAIRSYCVFTSIVYRVIMLGLIPAVMLFMIYLIHSWSEDSVGYVIAACMWTVSEVFGDFFTFGGICSAKENGMEYLKSSQRGMSVLRQALYVDGTRKALSAAVVFGGGYAVEYELGITERGILPFWDRDRMAAVCFVVGMAGICLGSTLAATLVSRFFANLMANLALAYVSAFLAAIGLSFAFYNSFAACPAGLLFGGVTLWLNSFVVVKRLKESYYD